MSKRMTKAEFDEMSTLGAFNPVGHAILAMENDAAAAEARQALLDAGFEDADILVSTSAEMFPNLDEMMRNASGAAGFGYEIVLMRRYMTLASEGAGWLVVYGPEDSKTAQIGEIAKRLGARTAVLYGRFLHQDLI